MLSFVHILVVVEVAEATGLALTVMVTVAGGLPVLAIVGIIALCKRLSRPAATPQA